MTMMGGTAPMIAGAMPAYESFTLDASAIRDWCGTAKAGEQLVYSVGWHLPPRSSGAARARKLQALGYVALAQKRLPNGMIEYRMQRLRPARAAVGRDPRQTRMRLDGDMARVMSVIRRCARTRQPCPQNRVLARLAGVINASYQLQKLVDAGFIESRIVDAASGARIITVKETGASTAVPPVGAR
ncbi:hypothetical protein [Sphingomonas nostoxanthinifaciens]|uniref:hypothetical protein n=1 Tax=Sphingomonas nostoxanthinifaciens TaxID=2872652 RepID=UPI001CC1C7E3|nr:hypothetical protein [Sphingomonas nostoxanthinifaciens]UAK24368.1 hypothetical protein K8P63_18980 [Sphingomonas nostoxanthinifaciens]